MHESEDVSGSLLRFAEKLKRFVAADSKDKNVSSGFDEGKILQLKINENLNDRISRIVGEYASFRIPASKSIEDDEESLVKCYQLFKSVLEINKSIGNGAVFVKSMEFESPFLKKECYVSKKDFIYLQAWLFFEKKIKDFFPVIVRERTGKVRLDFQEAEVHRFSGEEREIFRIIEEKFY